MASGAEFGISFNLLVIPLIAWGTEAVIPAVYGAEPELEQPIGNPAIGKALEQMNTIASGTTPCFLVNRHHRRRKR